MEKYRSILCLKITLSRIFCWSRKIFTRPELGFVWNEQILLAANAVEKSEVCLVKTTAHGHSNLKQPDHVQVHCVFVQKTSMKRWLSCHNRFRTGFKNSLNGIFGPKKGAPFHRSHNLLVFRSWFQTCKRLWSQGTDSLPRNRFRQAGNRFLVALKGLQIRALVNKRLYVNYIKDEGLSYFIFKSSCPPFSTIKKKMMGKKSFVHTLTRRGNGGGPCVYTGLCTIQLMKL
jgi:hypothetical protein